MDDLLVHWIHRAVSLSPLLLCDPLWRETRAVVGRSRQLRRTRNGGNSTRGRVIVCRLTNYANDRRLQKAKQNTMQLYQNKRVISSQHAIYEYSHRIYKGALITKASVYIAGNRGCWCLSWLMAMILYWRRCFRVFDGYQRKAPNAQRQQTRAHTHTHTLTSTYLHSYTLTTPPALITY